MTLETTESKIRGLVRGLRCMCSAHYFSQNFAAAGPKSGWEGSCQRPITVKRSCYRNEEQIRCKHLGSKRVGSKVKSGGSRTQVNANKKLETRSLRVLEWNTRQGYSHSTKNWIFQKLPVADTKAQYWEKRNMNPNVFILKFGRDTLMRSIITFRLV